MSDQDSILAALRHSADELAREVQRMPAADMLWRPSATDWCQHETLTHLWIAEHFVFLPRLRRMADEDNPLLPVVDEGAIQKKEGSSERPREELLDGFMADRRAELLLLAAHDWSRPGVHETNGPIDMAWIAHYALGHTWEHISQMMRVRLRKRLHP